MDLVTWKIGNRADLVYVLAQKLFCGLTFNIHQYLKAYCRSDYAWYNQSRWHPGDLRETDRRLAEIGEDAKKLEQFCDDRRRMLTEIQKVRSLYLI